MDNTTQTKYFHRFLARIIIEAVTPLAVGSGEKDIITDALVATDVNGLPYIPATAIAGVLRSMLEAEDIDKTFGFQAADKGSGSEIIFSEAKIINHKGDVIDGLKPDAIYSDELLRHYQELPIRQHVRMTDKGVAAKRGKFDEQVVYTGTRFCFEVEMVSEGENLNTLLSVLRQLYNKNFRIGGGTRCGFGEIKVIDIKIMDLNLSEKSDLEIYLQKTSALNTGFWSSHPDRLVELENSGTQNDDFLTFTVNITPDAFFLFGSGFGDNEADMTPVKAKAVEWSDKDGKTEGKLKENMILIPATSVKGALAHRVAFHYNRQQGVFADDLNGEETANIAGHNPVVMALFGSEGKNDKDFTRGNVIISDIIQDRRLKDKVFNHVAIDKFTGGGREGALFSEKATYGAGNAFTLRISIDKKRLEESFPELAEPAVASLQLALDDLCNGLLPLGGGVNRGHGIFSGSYIKHDKQ
ncbi:MAG: CRISPR-associated protein [Bacteroides sp.]|nr:CRISPR-associated protein [Bacteroides sp.]